MASAWAYGSNFIPAAIARLRPSPVRSIMLARHVMHVEPGLRDGAIGVVELGGLGEMCDVAGMNHERRFCGQRFDLPDRFLKRADRIGIGGCMEADMAIADLSGRSACSARPPAPGR
jgi:hypothetical protein